MTETLLPDDIPTPTPGHSTRHRLNGLDGIRAIAVIVVVLYHFSVPGFSGGWIGPEIFFVLSGYLITTLLLDRRVQGSTLAKLLDFWIRRIRRLYPALLFLMAALVGVIMLMTSLHDPVTVTVSPSAFRSEAFASMGYYANWHLISQHVDYFGQSTALLKHMWSLAIEEQFYLVFPFIFFAISRSSRYWRQLGVGIGVVGATISIFFCAHYSDQHDLLRAYYSTQSNAYHLLIGVIVAFALHGWAPQTRTKKLLSALAPVSLVALVLFVETSSAASGLPRPWMFHGGGVLLDLSAATLLISLVYGGTQGPVSWAFNQKPIVWIGAVSYGIYLWHYPFSVLLSQTNTHLATVWVVMLQIGATLGATVFSFYFVERVVRETQIPARRLRWTIYALSAVACVLLVGFSPQLIAAV